jgi:hypothetical protein
VLDTFSTSELSDAIAVMLKEAYRSLYDVAVIPDLPSETAGLALMELFKFCDDALRGDLQMAVKSVLLADELAAACVRGILGAMS